MDNKAFDIIDARCNHEDYTWRCLVRISFGTHTILFHPLFATILTFDATDNQTLTAVLRTMNNSKYWVSAMFSVCVRTCMHMRVRVCECVCVCVCGPSSSVGIATELRDGRSGIESRWGRDFSPFQTGPGAHPTSRKMSTGSFPGVKCGRGVTLTIHHLLVSRSWKSTGIPLPTLWATPDL